MAPFAETHPTCEEKKSSRTLREREHFCYKEPRAQEGEKPAGVEIVIMEKTSGGGGRGKFLSAESAIILLFRSFKVKAPLGEGKKSFRQCGGGGKSVLFMEKNHPLLNSS